MCGCYKSGMNEEQKIWIEALRRLNELDQLLGDQSKRGIAIDECRQWIEQQVGVPRLAALAPLIVPALDRRQLWSVLVPVERSVTRLRITDVDILDSDLPEGSRQGALMPVTVVVDSIRSAFNVGGILRTAECFGVAEVILCGYTPLPDNAQVARAALGADQLVKWRYVEKIRDAVRELNESGVSCYALETVAGSPLVGEVEWSFPGALVLGNERFGLDPDVIGLCKSAVRIQMYGAKNSLNVVSAFSVAAHQMRQQVDECEKF